MSRFEAKRTGDVVRFEWETATETGNAGFNLYVETVDGMEQINESLVPSSVIDSVEPVAYSYSAAVAGDLFYIEMVDIQNRTDLYGPFAVTESTATADFDGEISHLDPHDQSLGPILEFTSPAQPTQIRADQSRSGLCRGRWREFNSWNGLSNRPQITSRRFRAPRYLRTITRQTHSQQSRLVPERAILQNALLGLIVGPDDAETLQIALGPLEVVHERPDKVAGQRHAVFDGALRHREVLAQIVEPSLIVDLAVGVGAV